MMAPWREEHALEVAQGDSFRAYCARVGGVALYWLMVTLLKRRDASARSAS